MEPHSAILERTCLLLGIVPGVVVHRQWQEPGLACIEFTVQLEESASALEHIAMGANVANRPPIDRTFAVGRHTFAACTKARDIIVSGSLQLLAIHLTWYLHREGHLAENEANAWLRAWHAAPVGA